jgi:hypothetical protein
MTATEPTEVKRTPIWSGKNSIPEVGEIVAIPFGGLNLAGKMVGTFVTDGGKNDYTGVRLHMLELPPAAQNFGWAHGLEMACIGAGRDGLIAFASDPTSFEVGIFGAEIPDTTPVVSSWFSQHGLSAQEELIALIPSILGGKDWKEELSVTAWCNGGWHATNYSELSGTLQRIRNTAHMEFIEAAYAKNKALSDQCKSWLKQHQTRTQTQGS